MNEGKEVCATHWFGGRGAMLVVGVALLLIERRSSCRGCCSSATTSTIGHVVSSPGVVGETSGAHPIVEFAGSGGGVVRYRQNGMGERPVGSAVPLLYDPAAPADTAIARSFWTRWGATGAAFATGLAFVAVALAGGGFALSGPTCEPAATGRTGNPRPATSSDMTEAAFLAWADQEGIRADAYAIGTPIDQTYVIERRWTGWSVYYLEKGLRHDDRSFLDASPAFADLAGRLRSDASTRIHPTMWTGDASRPPHDESPA